MITQKDIKLKLEYFPDSGHFRWRHAVSNSVKACSVAGTKVTSGYIAIKFKDKAYMAHRLAWLYVYGEWPKYEIDHINQDKCDNRISNLRDVTRSDNLKNQKKSKNNTSGVTGVVWDKRWRRWRAQIWSNKKSISIGLFSDKFEAICARKSANNRYGFHDNHGR